MSTEIILEDYPKRLRIQFPRDILPFHQIRYRLEIGEERIFEQGLKAFENSWS